jgi:hypothetical protein
MNSASLKYVKTSHLTKGHPRGFLHPIERYRNFFNVNFRVLVSGVGVVDNTVGMWMDDD